MTEIVSMSIRFVQDKFILTKFSLVCFILIATTIESIANKNDSSATTWSVQRANQWYASHNWIVGVNYIPSSAVNQLEMWQSKTFDPTSIRRELNWAKKIGFNTVRVYLHHLAWLNDSVGFRNRIEHFLQLSDEVSIKTIFVFFEDVWNGFPVAGNQQKASPGVHNSRWVQDPGQDASSDSSNFHIYENYITSVIGHFSRDKRILFWDLYNEPGSNNKGAKSLPLLETAFRAARSVRPIQPLTAGIWYWKADQINMFLYRNSDIITYHNYDPPATHQKVLFGLQLCGRPIICTEYMARRRNSRFSNILPLLRSENVGAISWGLVAGKTNTIFQWDTPIYLNSEPHEWFHDILRYDGTPYDEQEIAIIKNLIQTEENKLDEQTVEKYIFTRYKHNLSLTLHIFFQNFLALMSNIYFGTVLTGFIIYWKFYWISQKNNLL